MSLVQEVHVEDLRVLVNGPQEDLHLEQVHDHPVDGEDVPHQVLKHDEGLHQEVLGAGGEGGVILLHTNVWTDFCTNSL